MIIRNSRFRGVDALRVYGTQGTSLVERNELLAQEDEWQSLAYSVKHNHAPFSQAPHQHIARNNRFELRPGKTAVLVERPGVTLEHNEFVVLEQSDKENTAIKVNLQSEYHDKRTILDQAHIQYNVFKSAVKPAVGTAISLHHSSQIKNQSVHIENNDLSQVATAVQATPDAGWLSDDPVVFNGNVVGNARNDLRPESVKSPRDAAVSRMGIQGLRTPAPVPSHNTQPAPTPTNAPAPTENPTTSPTANPSPSPSASTGSAPSNPPAPQPPASSAPTANPLPVPSPAPTTKAVPRSVARIAGETRFETAVELSKQLFPNGAKAVIIARSDVAADSVAAAALAKAEQAPVLLTQSNALHASVQAEVKRLMPNGGKVIVMGGEAAIAKSVETKLATNGNTVERVAGPNRAGTAVAVAKRLQAQGKAQQVLLANGADWQPTMIAGPAAAANEAVMLLTNDDAMAPETAEFLQAAKQVPVTPVGTKAYDAATKVALTQQRNHSDALVTTDPTALSVAVAKQFFTKPTQVGVATTADFADALAGGAHIAHLNGPILLLPAEIPAAVPTYLDEVQTVSKVNAYGGPSRFTDGALEQLNTK